MTGLLRSNNDYGSQANNDEQPKQPTGDDAMESREILAGLMVKTAKLLVTMEEKRFAYKKPSINKQQRGQAKVLVKQLLRVIDKGNPAEGDQSMISAMVALVEHVVAKYKNLKKDSDALTFVRGLLTKVTNTLATLEQHAAQERTVIDQIEEKRPGK